MLLIIMIGHLALPKITGDNTPASLSKKIITDILKRDNALDRPSIANVDVALILTSIKKPDLSLNLLDKLVLVIMSKEIEPVICISKFDLVDSKEKKEYKKIFKYYEKIGIKVFFNTGLRKIRKYLKGKTVVLQKFMK